MSDDQHERLLGYFIARHFLRDTRLSDLVPDRPRRPKSARSRVICMAVFVVTAALALGLAAVVDGVDDIAVLRASAAGFAAALIANRLRDRGR